MNTIKAHGMFAARTDRTIFQHPVKLDVNGETCDCWPAAMVALCDCSNGLDEAETDADLDELIQEGIAYIEAGLLTEDEIDGATWAIVQEVLQWGDELSKSRERNGSPR